MELIIRNAQVIDAAALCALSKQLGYPSTVPQLEYRLQQVLNGSDQCVFVALLDGKQVGWIHGFYAIRIESDAFVEIGGLVVDVNFQRKGIGRKLVDSVTEWARQWESIQVRVRCNRLRADAHGFYEGLGFREVKEQKVFML